MNPLLAGFLGEGNSAKIILDRSSNKLSKLYLDNDFDKCAIQIQKAVFSNSYDFILVLGQKPVIKSIYIETVGKMQPLVLKTQCQWEVLASYLKKHGFKVKISSNAGNYLCNHVYFHGLNAIEQASLSTDMLFIHVPVLKNITDLDCLASSLSNFLVNR